MARIFSAMANRDAEKLLATLRECNMANPFRPQQAANREFFRGGGGASIYTTAPGTGGPQWFATTQLEVGVEPNREQIKAADRAAAMLTAYDAHVELLADLKKWARDLGEWEAQVWRRVEKALEQAREVTRK